MVEIALCIAIVAFALVAIIGVLPTGMRVQKDNREDTVINQDGTYWLEAIRSGALGLDDLTNYVDLITINRYWPGGGGTEQYVYGDGRIVNGTNTFPRGSNVIGLLSTPKYVYDADGRLIVSEVTAFVRSLSGTADLKPDPGKKQTVMIRASTKEQPVEVSVKDMAFKYRLRSEIVPFEPLPRPRGVDTDWGAAGLSEQERAARYQNWLRALEEKNLKANAYDVRLTLDWPVYSDGATTNMVGGYRKVFRTLVSASMSATVIDPKTTLFFFQPSTFMLAR